MARKPVNQHRMLLAVKQGRVSNVASRRMMGTWQIWEPESGSLRPVTSPENMALDALARGGRPMVELMEPTLSGQRREAVLTDYGAVTLQLWTDDPDMPPLPA